MTICQFLNQMLPVATRQQSRLTGIFYLVHVRCRGGHWQEVRKAKHLLEDITDETYFMMRIDNEPR